jgi:poly [ADP-ribose] polymerase 10/14/15
MISVAIPSIGTGNLRFPNDVVAKITVEEAISYLSSQKRGSLEFVHLVIFMDDTYKAFKKVLSSYGPRATLPTAADDDNNSDDDDSNDDENDDSFPPPSMPIARVKKSRRMVGTRSTTLPSTASGMSECLTLDIDNIMVHLINGDITDSTCDAIVNPTNPQMQLTGAGVAGAILKKGGREQQDLCDAVISAVNKLDEGKVMRTKATGDLKSKYIFHINHEGRNVKKLSDVIAACLDLAVKLHLTSIAFPAVGTGTNGCLPRESAASLIQAIRTFASSSSSKLQQIHVVLCEPRILQDFQEVFKHPEEAQPSMLQRAFNSLYSLVVGGPSKSSADPKVVPVEEVISVCKQLEVNIYGQTKIAVEQAHHKVVSWIDEALSDRVISNPYVQSLPEEDEEKLKKICNKLHVEIDIDRESSRIFIKGNRISVDKVHTAVTESLNQFEKKNDKREHAKHMYEMVRWVRKLPNDLEGEEYEEIESFEIEMAHSKGQPSCTIGTSADIEYYTIDFTTGKETDHITGVISEVERIDVLKQLQEGMFC